jgi:hypothetical protein
VPHTPSQRPDTDVEFDQRRLIHATVLVAASVVLWMAPLALLTIPTLPSRWFILGVGMTGALSVALLGLGIQFLAQRRGLRHHQTMLVQFRADILQAQAQAELAAEARHAELLRRIECVTVQVGQDYWNSYSDGVADVVGGQNSSDTHRLQLAPVTPLPRHRTVTGKTS